MVKTKQNKKKTKATMIPIFMKEGVGVRSRIAISNKVARKGFTEKVIT